ncbi:unnamed protein product [Microthlaspi erraticum]|nr:unnamed protein product [Microthlaspi erraticum]
MHMQIPLFNGEDHEIWSIKMKTLLMARDLWDVVESGVSEETKKDLRIKDMTALHMLQMSVTDSIFLRIGRATSSKQAWEILKADFGETELIQSGKREDLVLEFYDMRMKNEESFHEFIEKFMEVVSRSKFYGHEITDQELIRRVLRSLAPRFNQYVINVRSEDYTLSELLYILGEFDRELASQNQEAAQLHSNNKRGRR